MDEFEDLLDFEPEEVEIPCAQATEEPPQLEVRTPPPSKKRFTFKPVEPADDDSGDNGTASNDDEPGGCGVEEPDGLHAHIPESILGRSLCCFCLCL